MWLTRRRTCEVKKREQVLGLSMAEGEQEWWWWWWWW